MQHSAAKLKVQGDSCT